MAAITKLFDDRLIATIVAEKKLQLSNALVDVEEVQEATAERRTEYEEVRHRAAHSSACCHIAASV